MSDILFLFLYLLTPVVSFFLLRAARVDLFQITIPSIFFAYYLMVGYVGVAAIYFDWTWYTYIDVSDRAGILKLCLYSGSTLLLTTFGFFLLSRWKGSRKASQWTPPEAFRKSAYIPLLLMIVVCLVVTKLYLQNFSGSALSTSIEGDTVEAKILRSQMTTDFQGTGRFHYYSFFFQSLFPFCTYVVISQALLKRRVFLWVIAGGCFMLALYSVLAGAEKAPAVWLILGCLMAYIHAVKGRIKFKTIVLLVSISSAMVFITAMLFVGFEGRTTADLVGWAMSRILAGGIVPSYFYLTYFPDFSDFLMGKSLPNPRGIFPWETVRLTQEMANFMHGDSGNLETVSSAPTAYWAELYANFGPFGPIVGAPLVGAYIYAIHVLLGKLRPTPIKTALVVWCSLHFMKLAESGITGFLLDTDLILILMSGFVLLLADGQFVLRWRERGHLQPQP